MSVSCVQAIRLAASTAVTASVVVMAPLAVIGLCTTFVAVAVGSTEVGAIAVAAGVAGTLVAVGRGSGVGSDSLSQAATNKHKLTAITQARHDSNRLKPSSPRFDQGAYHKWGEAPAGKVSLLPRVPHLGRTLVNMLILSYPIHALCLMVGDVHGWGLIRLQNHQRRR